MTSATPEQLRQAPPTGSRVGTKVEPGGDNLRMPSAPDTAVPPETSSAPSTGDGRKPVSTASPVPRGAPRRRTRPPAARPTALADGLTFTVAEGTASPAQPLTLAEAGLRERSHLQEWVVAHPEMLGDGILIVTSEFDRWAGSARAAATADRLDVLGLARDGRLLLAELKRDRAPDLVEMQAIKYAALASRFNVDTLAAVHAAWSTKRGVRMDEEQALRKLQDHAGDLSVETLRQPRIAILAADFPATVTSAALWLTEIGLEIKLVKVSAYKGEHDIVISVTQAFPPPRLEDFAMTPQQTRLRSAEERQQRQRDISTTARLVRSAVITDGTVLTLRPRGVNEEIRASIEAWVAAEAVRGTARWRNDETAPLEWESDHERYSVSGLAQLIVLQAAAVSRSIRGGEWWVTDDGRDLVEIANDLASPPAVPSPPGDQPEA